MKKNKTILKEKLESEDSSFLYSLLRNCFLIYIEKEQFGANHEKHTNRYYTI